MNLIDEMTEKGFKPDAYVYSNVFQELIHRGGVDRKSVFHRFKKLRYEISYVFIYIIIISIWTLMIFDWIHRLTRLFSEEGVRFDESSYSELFSSLMARDIDAMLIIFDWMHEDQVTAPLGAWDVVAKTCKLMKESL